MSTDKKTDNAEEQKSGSNFLPSKSMDKESPPIPTCTTCGRPLTQCSCTHNDLIK